MGEEVNDGGPAFPVADFIHPNGRVEHGHNGMSLLEYYAGEAMKAGLEHWLEHTDGSWDARREMAADLAFDVAEAMIAESESHDRPHQS